MGKIASAKEEQKTKKKLEPNRHDANRKPPCPAIFFEKVDASEEISKMRQVVNKGWNQIYALEAAITTAKAMTLAEG